MSKKIFSAIGIGVAILVVALLSFTFSSDENMASTTSDEKITSIQSDDSGLGISYTAVNYQLKQILQDNNISMSSPIKLDKLRDIWIYCNFFEGDEQKLVEYCTSTELRDADDNFLGNIHAVGTPEEPRLIMAVVQVDPFLNNKDDAKDVFSVLTNQVVCDCWSTKIIQGLSMDDWANKHIEFHIGGGKPTSKSNIIPLEGKSLQMELTTNNEGYLWTLFVTG